LFQFFSGWKVVFFVPLVTTKVFVLLRFSLILSDLIIEFSYALAVMDGFDLAVLVEVTLLYQKELTASTVSYFLHLTMTEPAEFSLTRFV
jgi:hypothetical protein